MQKKMLLIFIVLAMGAALLLPGVAAANLVLYFDDVVAGNPLPQATPLTDGYGGFEWSGMGGYWGIMPNSYYRSIYHNNFDFPTNPNAVTNESPDHLGALTVTISCSSPFNFDGAYFGANNNGQGYGATSLTIIGKLGDTEVGTTIISLNKGPLTWYAVNFHNIDSVTFLPLANPKNGGRYFVMDNFTDSAIAVPLPSTLLLLGSGLAGLGFRRLRRNCAS